ncbi:hypothetical protein MAIT1_04018 [Magnetofaba australis IT-1]|uniref:Uncharacterized protein n=1 Tax=Magnetofaba australis IT-1 TaxID=1434232 RepID=A0A1Y2K473_9PROT|nr:hypothetical protein MAIT1_04018 [Magnetofaba australis IT-1]
MGVEDGSAHLDVARFPQPKTWEEVLDAIQALFQEEHNFKTLVLDSIDWAERLAAESVCKEHGVKTLEDIPYGKWKGYLLSRFTDLLRALDALHQARGMIILLIGHAEIRTFNDPENEPYDRYVMKCQDKVSAMIREWCDINLFANFDTCTRVVGQGFNAKAKGVSYGKRFIYSQRRAAFDAKSRFPIPDRLPLEWDTFWNAYQAAVNPQEHATTTDSVTAQQGE